LEVKAIMGERRKSNDNQTRVQDEITHPFGPRFLLPNISAGLINGVLVVMCAISFAAMIFSGGLSIYLSKGIGLTLYGEHCATASVMTKRRSVVHFLSRKRYREMDKENPEMSAQFHKMLVAILGMRLESATNPRRTGT
jgi:hypothetical protein